MFVYKKKTEEMKGEKQKLKKSSRGITIIALIITIIVLLILAGVALASLFGENGLLNNAETAKNETNIANSKEQVHLAVTAAMTYPDSLGIVTKENLVAELDKLLGTGEENYKITSDDEVGAWKLPSASFSQVAGTDLSNGLTITNTTDGSIGNQNYVWIEVPTTISERITRDGIVETVTLAEAVTDDEIREILEVYVGKGTEQDYTKGASSQSKDWEDKWYDSNGKTADTEGVDLTDTAGCGMTYTEYQTAYSKMLNSIKDNG